MLQEILNAIDDALKNNFKEIYKSLELGATDEQLKQLQNVCFEGKPIPEDFIALYRWHNGQTGYYSLNQEDNRTFMPIAEVISAWNFLNDPKEDILEPISKSWIPFTYNGAGDYLVYDTEGEKKGSILNYWHDDEDRPVECENLLFWAKSVLNAAKS